MIQWKKLTRHDPQTSDEAAVSRPPSSTAPAVKAWCLMTIIANAIIALTVATVMQRGDTLLPGVFWTLFPLPIRFFWRDLAPLAESQIQLINRLSPFKIRIDVGVQWLAIAACICSTLMLCATYVLLWPRS